MAKDRLIMLIAIVPAYLLIALCLALTFSQEMSWSSYDQDEWFLLELFKREKEAVDKDPEPEVLKKEPNHPTVAYGRIFHKVIDRMALSPEGRKRLNHILSAHTFGGEPGEYILVKVELMKDPDIRFLLLAIDGLKKSRTQLIASGASEVSSEEAKNEREAWKVVVLWAIDQMALYEKGKEKLKGMRAENWCLKIPKDIIEHIENKVE